MPLLRKLVVQIEIAGLQKSILNEIMKPKDFAKKNEFHDKYKAQKTYYQPLQQIANKSTIPSTYFQSNLYNMKNTWSGIINLFKGTSSKFPRSPSEKIYTLTNTFNN